MTDIIEAWAWYNGYKRIAHHRGYWWWDKYDNWFSPRDIVDKCKEQMMNL